MAAPLLFFQESDFQKIVSLIVPCCKRTDHGRPLDEAASDQDKTATDVALISIAQASCIPRR
jgi:hypothetical protein